MHTLATVLATAIRRTPEGGSSIPAMKTCPFCAEQIRDEAIVCMHCRRDLVPKPQPVIRTKAQTSTLAWIGAALLLFLLALWIYSLLNPLS